ncbi:hypothetical protein Q8W71_07150 [Methylobacterium sp. NEAU 140]|uniref:hypothetical protein n=1 Tax=Methylobacterium sp. NEAU 140 TaxID=3064945 RepID=UPI002737198C|nr:hypothetical protein [Methylobacterium sp. NEAU 140]MDP4022393.1 hypothetical protein [Methylobacterium sp. NEAU 140]
MSIFLEIADQYALADTAFADAERTAFQADDDAAFDRAAQARQRNDQAYFLYLFTRYEAAVNAAIDTLLRGRADPSASWADRRVWQAWSRLPVRDIPLLSKVEVLTDKGRGDYATSKQYYEGRNAIAHGAIWEAQFFVPDVARTMHHLANRFVTT